MQSKPKNQKIPRTRPPNRPSRWDKDGGPPLELIIDWYDAWLRSGSLKQVQHILELNQRTYNDKFKKHPVLLQVKEIADKRREERNTFTEYIYQHLSPEAREVWKKIEFWTEEGNPTEQIDRILAGQTKKLRQELFVHALVMCNFDPSAALRMVGVSRDTYETWRYEDLNFRRTIEEIQWHKKNFFEHALTDLVMQRHPAAVLFVNRTVNADRGYGEKLDLKHTVQGGFQLEDLDLDPDTKRKILEAIRKKKAEQLAGGNGKTIDVHTEPSVHMRQALPAPVTQD